MAKMGFSSWLLVVALLSQGVWSRPPVREVKLITEPSPGQEYVSIQSSMFSQKAVKTPPSEPEGDFATSHKIPGQLPIDEPEDEDEVDFETLPELPSKIKRDNTDLLSTLQEAILTPDLVPIVEKQTTKTEFRMEFSVVTSKPRKEVKDYKDRTPAVPSKIAVNQKKVALKSVEKEDDAPEFEVEVDSKGNFGKLDAGLTGSDEKKVMLKKQSVAGAAVYAAKEPVKGQEQILKAVEINPASEVGVKSPEVESEVGAITVPIQKQQSIRYPTTTASLSLSTYAPAAEKAYDILPVNLVKSSDKTKEKDFDFEDSPLGDKILIPAGSNQQSRIEVKKGPNGQDYEYEYVYYYYDDEENDTSIDSGDKKSAASKSSTAAPTTTTETPITTARQHLSEVIHHDTVDHARGRGRTRAPAVAVVAEPEVGGRNKYASIERTAGTVASETSNEIIPARGTPARSRGRTVTTEEPSTISAEERLPANTRFPPRSRSNHNSNSISVTTPVAPPQDAPAPRVRGGSSVRRPNLELVDSSSFKTQSSDASRDQDLRPEFPSRLPGANEEEEVEEVVKPRGSRVRGPTSTAAPEVDEEDEDISDAPRRGQPIRRPSNTQFRTPFVQEEEEVVEDTSSSVPATEPAETVPSSDVTTTTVEDVGLTLAMDKAAIELYSLFQQAQAENSIDEESTDLSADEEITTELEEITTTQEPTTLPPTTTTTTTVAPTTTTTEATTAAAVGRGRQRQRGYAGASTPRNRFRANKDDATSTTTEAPAETSTKARRFGGNRVTSGSYGRRGFSKATTAHPEEHSDSEKEEEAVKEAAKVETSAPAVRTGGFSRNRFSAGRTSRVTTSTTASPTPSDDSAPSSPSSSAPAKPVFADRFNSLRRRGGSKQSTTVAPLNEETKSDSSGEETNEPSTLSDVPSTTAKPSGRTRLSIGSGPRPLRPSPRVNIGGRSRLGATTTTTTTAAPSTEVDEGSNEQTSSSSQDEAQSQSDEAQEAVTTPIPDALTRLRNRPRLRVNAKQAAVTAAPVVRRPLGLLPRRRPQPAEVKEASDSESQDSSNASSNSEESDISVSSEETSEASTDSTSSATTVQEQPQENNRLSSLLSGRRKGNALRRQRTLFPAGPKLTNQEGSS